MALQFEWDEAKADANVTKHGIAFQEATTVFQDPFLVTFFDELHSEYEDRFISIGESEQQRLLLISHTESDTTIRIISARNATRKEKAYYDQRP